jgi:IS605 OrfB family transposase
MSTLVTRTLKIRVKDKHAVLLQRMATQVNQVWNFCNETSSRSIRERSTWLSGFDLQKYTNGFSKCDGVLIGSKTIQQVCEEYVTRRKQFKKAKLRWRVSNPKSSRRSLGWIPFKSGALVYANGQIQFAGHRLSLWDSYGLSNYKLRAGNFNQDVRGRWYLNVVVQIPTVASSGKRSVGMDLGVKTAVTTSDGQKLAGHWYRDQEEALARAQRAKKKDRVRAIHAKIANQRKDALHKFSHAMVSQYGAIFVGDISSQWMLKTSSAKGTLDASWSRLKIMLEYKSQQAGVIFEVVNEAYTTQTCSCCGNIPSSSPKGRAGLRVREWTCSDCGAHHDRDVNAAINILAALRCAKTMPQRGIWPEGHRIHAKHEYIAV